MRDFDASLQSTYTILPVNLRDKMKMYRLLVVGRSKHRRLFFLKKNSHHFLCACIALCQRQGDSQVSRIRHNTCYASRTKPTRYTERKYSVTYLCIYTHALERSTELRDSLCGKWFRIAGKCSLL